MNTSLFLISILFSFSLIIISLLLVISTFREKIPSQKKLLSLPEKKRFYSGIYSKYNKPCKSKHLSIMQDVNDTNISAKIIRFIQTIYSIFL